MLSRELFVLADCTLTELEKSGVDPARQEEFACYAILAALVRPVGSAVTEWLELRKMVDSNSPVTVDKDEKTTPHS
jgi:hypothetical protein